MEQLSPCAHNDGPTLQSPCSKTSPQCKACAMQRRVALKPTGSSEDPAQPKERNHFTGTQDETNIKKKEKVLCRTWRNRSEPSRTTGGKAKRCSRSSRQARGFSRGNRVSYGPATPGLGTHPRETCVHTETQPGTPQQQHSQQAGAQQLASVDKAWCWCSAQLWPTSESPGTAAPRLPCPSLAPLTWNVTQ